MKITSLAPCSGQTSPLNANQLSEKPFMMISGRMDDIVPFANQQSIYNILRLNFSENIKSVFYAHNSGHSLPNDGPRKIIEFFKEIDVAIINN